MREVTIKIEDKVHDFYKSLGEGGKKSVEETIALAVWDHYMLECEDEILDFNTILGEGKGGMESEGEI